MRSPTAALGSLAALASLVVSPDASAQLTLSSLSDISLGDYNNAVLAIDIDGNAVTDFNISVDNFFTVGVWGMGINHVARDAATLVPLSLGDIVGDSLDFNGYANFSNFSGGGTQYVGVQFDISGNTHYGWLEFNFPTTEFIDGTLVSAGWQATTGASATISSLSAVPEPASAGLWGGLIAGFAGFWRRRRRSPQA